MTHYKDQTMILWMWITFVWAGPTFICICQRVSAAAACRGRVAGTGAANLEQVWQNNSEDQVQLLCPDHSGSSALHCTHISRCYYNLLTCLLFIQFVMSDYIYWQFSFYGFPLSTNFLPPIVCRCHQVCCRAAIVPGRVSWPIIGCPDNTTDTAAVSQSYALQTIYLVSCFAACYIESVNNFHL